MSTSPSNIGDYAHIAIHLSFIVFYKYANSVTSQLHYLTS